MSDDDEPSDDAVEEDERLPAEQRTVDAASPKQYRKRVRKAKIAQQASEQFWRDIFATELGRREMWSILAAAHTFETRFANGPVGFPDPNATWYERGVQDFGTRLREQWFLVVPELVVLMHHENDPRFVKRKPKGD